MKAILLIFFFIPISVFCQENLPSGKAGKNAFNLLLTAGVSPSQVHGDAYSGFHKLGAIGGIGVESVFTEKASANLSFIFIQKGARKNQNLEKNDLNYFLVVFVVQNKSLVNYEIDLVYHRLFVYFAIYY